MQREWEPEDLVAAWTLLDDDWVLVANKTGHSRLGFALLLKFFEAEARFLRHAGELPSAAVDYVAAQVKVGADQLAKYAWSGRTIEYHRSQVRSALRFREATRADEEALTAWLGEEVAPDEVSEDRLREALLARCRSEHIEPPGRIERIIGAARSAASDRFCATTAARLGLAAADRLEQLVAGRGEEDDEGGGGRGVLGELKADPGQIGTRAENRVEGELLADLHRVRGKEGILFRLAEAAVEHPDDTVRTALYPVVSEATLRDLVKEAKATEAVFKTRVRKALRSSYSSYYRRMLPRLLGALQFRSNNSAHRPVIEALDLLGRYAERPGTVRFYAGAETVPLAGVVPADWETAVVDERDRVERIPYELCVLRALRDGLRRREIWVVGANRWRDPEADLPADFEVSREVHYTALRQPLDPSAFVDELRRRMRTALASLDAAVSADATGGVRFVTRRANRGSPSPSRASSPSRPTWTVSRTRSAGGGAPSTCSTS